MLTLTRIIRVDYCIDALMEHSFYQCGSTEISILTGIDITTVSAFASIVIYFLCTVWAVFFFDHLH